MNLKNKILYALVFAFAFAQFSCTDDFEEMNTPKTAVTEVTPVYFIPRLQDKGVFDNYQRNINLYADLYSQYMSNCAFGWPTANYKYNDGWIKNAWKEFYTRRLNEYKAVYEVSAGKETFDNVRNIAEIWFVYLYQRMTDRYGDIPYSGKYTEGYTYEEKYIEQSKIYPDLIKRLTDAQASLKQDDASQATPGEYDLVYQGDIAKWKQFANTLRLRMALRMSNIDKTNALKYAKEAIDAGVMTSNAANAYVFKDQKGWYDDLTTIWGWGSLNVSNTFMDLLNGASNVEDPRKTKLFKAGSTGEFKSLANGYKKSPEGYTFAEYATINKNEGGYFYNASSILCADYSETCFLLAEAKLRGVTSDKLSKTVEEYFQAGVKASMDHYKVSDEEASLYIGGLSLGTGNEAQFKNIITQKWLSNFTNSPESWAEFRRTGYPEMDYPVYVHPEATVAAGKWVKRVRYPDNEYNTFNTDNMPDFIKGDRDNDRMDRKVWWGQDDLNNPTNF